MIDPQHMNEGMENLTQMADLEWKVDVAVQELREILKVYHYNAINGFGTPGTLNMSADVVTKLENLLGSLLKK